jgi:hypothetical protein
VAVTAELACPPRLGLQRGTSIALPFLAVRVVLVGRRLGSLLPGGLDLAIIEPGELVGARQ